MASIYTSFLQSPSASMLAQDASLHYITTTTTFTEPAAILKHLQSQQKLITKKDEKILSSIEGSNGLCLETEITIQFNAGGGAYLPGMDENLLDEKLVTFPMVHIVGYDASQKIQQIRLYWDQGTLLKQVEAIGRTGRNWPIRDGHELVKAIKASVKAAGQAPVNGTAPLTLRDGNAQRDRVTATRDPHASLSLFAPRTSDDEPKRNYEGPAIKQRESAKPAPREYGELFAGEESTGSKYRSPSPSKPQGHVFKAGAGKQFGENRLFEEEDDLNSRMKSPEGKKTYENKYDHFAFGNGEDASQKKAPANSSAQAHFSFEDFHTPPKVNDKPSARFERSGFDQVDPPSPLKRPIVHAARPTSKSNFVIADESPAQPDGKSKKPLSTLTSVDQNRRGQDFNSQFDVSDASRAGKGENVPPHVKSRTDQEQHWRFGESPAPVKKIYKTAGDGMGGRGGSNIFDQSTTPEKKIYKTAGDGMGGRSARVWGFGDESDPEVEADMRSSARSRMQSSQQKAGAEY